uniref:Contactin 1 n=1 Tax=Anabas testudineus TaxID=64144 RepID=A0A7N6BN63_ANATE
VCLFSADEATGYGPVFEEQPVDTIYPEELPEAKITMNCRARANPPATYKWRLNNMIIDLNEEGSHYSLAGGNLVISNPIKTKHEGKYSCLATNIYGTVISQEGSVQFGYLDLFSSEERETVKVKEGQGAVLLCAPPPHHPADLSFRWILNEFPTFIPLDNRRFVSQKTGNLHISKVDSSDTGNYSCIASSPSISKSVFSNYIPLVPQAERRKYPADLEVKFPETTALIGQNITLECFALGNPVPEIHWKKMGGNLPHSHEVRMAGAQLHLFNVQFEDDGTYRCEAVNSRGKDYHTARVSVEAFPEWVEHIRSTEKDLGSEYTMSCVASGKPKPHIRWLKNGEPRDDSCYFSQLDRKEMKFSSLTFDDSGMYQCIAENRHGIIYANAELRVFACAPTFEHNPVKRVLAPKNRAVVIECRPKAAPKPTFSWSKDTELLSNSTRVFIWEDGSLEILNVTQADEGRYTCYAENDRGKANSTGTLLVTALICNHSCHSQSQQTPDLQMSTVVELCCLFCYFMQNGSSNGELLIRNAQLKHAGRYTCTAQTPVDNVTASAHLVVRGPPGAPGGVRVINKTDKSVTLQWSRGADNHSPISKYTIQYRDSFSRDVWKNAPTSPVDVEGNAETAMVVDLFPWTEYEFRVIATNTLGTGEPSSPSPKDKTLKAVPVVAPSDVGGGGGTSRELTITWTPVQPQYYYGSNFGYIVAFKPQGDDQWMKVTVADPQANRYVHKDSSIPPSTEFQVKVKAFNSEGEGPYSLTAIIYSAQDGKHRRDSQLSTVKCQNNLTDQPGPVFSIVENQESFSMPTCCYFNLSNHTRLEGMKPNSHYLVEIQGYNSAGFGPPRRIHIHTKKARMLSPSRAPKIIRKKLKGKSVNIAWEHVEPLANEASINGYKVLYRQQGQSTGTVYITNNRYIDLPLPPDGRYVVEVRARTDGGDGAVARIDISGGGVMTARSLGVLSLLLVALLCLNL